MRVCARVCARVCVHRITTGTDVGGRLPSSCGAAVSVSKSVCDLHTTCGVRHKSVSVPFIPHKVARLLRRRGVLWDTHTCVCVVTARCRPGTTAQFYSFASSVSFITPAAFCGTHTRVCGTRSLCVWGTL